MLIWHFKLNLGCQAEMSDSPATSVHLRAPRCGGVCESGVGQRVQVWETGALINTATKAVLFRSACVSLRQVDRISFCFVVSFVWPDNEDLLPPLPSPIEDEWKAFFEPEICQDCVSLKVWAVFLQLTVLAWLEGFFTQKMNKLWCNCTLEGSRRVMVAQFC